MIHVQEELHAWGERSDFLAVHVMTWDAWERSFLADIAGDAGLLAVAVALVTTYSFFVLGALSPVHFRACTAMVGMLCVVLGAASGYAVAFFLLSTVIVTEVSSVTKKPFLRIPLLASASSWISLMTVTCIRRL